MQQWNKLDRYDTLEFLGIKNIEITERTFNSVTEHGIKFRFDPYIDVIFWGEELKKFMTKALELLNNYDLAHADESFDTSTFTTENKTEEKPMKPRDVVCPTCDAAVGAKCLEKKLDGHSFIESYHIERYKASEKV
jgi:hypothetical protein